VQALPAAPTHRIFYQPLAPTPTGTLPSPATFWYSAAVGLRLDSDRNNLVGGAVGHACDAVLLSPVATPATGLRRMAALPATALADESPDTQDPGCPQSREMRRCKRLCQE
jgi:hypothetical protein